MLLDISKWTLGQNPVISPSTSIDKEQGMDLNGTTKLAVDALC
ncbi:MULTISPECIES: hypothetical protein [Vibrio]|nr:MULTISPECIES: hypothetical protein [Vibrio]